MVGVFCFVTFYMRQRGIAHLDYIFLVDVRMNKVELEFQARRFAAVHLNGQGVEEQGGGRSPNYVGRLCGECLHLRDPMAQFPGCGEATVAQARALGLVAQLLKGIGQEVLGILVPGFGIDELVCDLNGWRYWPRSINSFPLAMILFESPIISA